MVEKCPACGATIPGLVLKCPECGYVFPKEKESSKEIRDEIKEIQTQLLSAIDDKERMTIINTLSAPNTKEGLMNMLAFACSQFKASNGYEDAAITNAWLEKAKHMYSLLILQSSGDKELAKQLQQFAFLETEKQKVKQSVKSRNKKKWIRITLISLSVIVIVYLFLLIISNLSGDEVQAKSVKQEVIELVQKGRYDEARIKAAEAEYSWEERELLDMIEQASNKE